MIESREPLSVGDVYETTAHETVEILAQINYYGKSAFLAVLTGPHTGFQHPAVYDEFGHSVTPGATDLYKRVVSNDERRSTWFLPSKL